MKKFFVLCLMLVLFSPLYFFNFAYADEVKLTSNVESGTWTNESVVIEFVGPVEKSYYSFDNLSWSPMANNSVTFEEEMEATVFFKALDQSDNLLLQTSFEVKIDKTPPSEMMIFGVPTTYTTQDVEIIVTANGATEYSFFNGDFTAQNKVIITQNIVFEVGDIKARDNAGNMVCNSYPIVIDKIDKQTPKFYVLTNTSSKRKRELVTFELDPIISGIKSFYYTLNDQKVDISVEYKKGIYLSENGVYEFVLVSNVGKTYKVSVEFNNLGRTINPWLKNGILIFLFLVFLLFFVWTVVLHQKNKANAKIDKK